MRVFLLSICICIARERPTTYIPTTSVIHTRRHTRDPNDVNHLTLFIQIRFLRVIFFWDPSRTEFCRTYKYKDSKFQAPKFPHGKRNSESGRVPPPLATKHRLLVGRAPRPPTSIWSFQFQLVSSQTVHPTKSEAYSPQTWHTTGLVCVCIKYVY